MKKFAIAFAALVCAGPAVADDGCMLRPLGTLALTETATGALTVPVTIAGSARALSLELGVPDTAVAEALATELKLPTDTLVRHTAIPYRGTIVNRQVTLPQIQIGGMSGAGLTVLLLPAGASLPAGAAGVLGSRLLSNSDVEVDFAGHKANLFSPQHCPGAVVYWADTAAVIPFTLLQDRVVFQMTLDGKQVSVSFGASGTGAMPLSAARRVFGFGSAEAVADFHAFKTLGAGGITINNPAIRVVDDTHDPCNGQSRPMTCDSRTDLEVGLSELKSLHLFFAFAEGKLYVTAADAHK